MSLKAVFFDLDGTLLPMDQDFFIKNYFGSISEYMKSYGYDPQELVKAIWQGTGAMIKNDGTCTNEEAFWGTFVKIYGEACLKDLEHFDRFYVEQFDSLKSVCGFNPKAKEIVDYLKSKEIKVVLATNPIFPSIATEKRIAFAGLEAEDFEFFTSYENIGCSKPNLRYYEEVLSRAGVDPADVLMVGNDVSDDMVAKKLGVKVFLLTDCLINKDGEDISLYPNGNFDALKKYIDTII